MSWACLPTVAIFLLLADPAVAQVQKPQPADPPEETITVTGQREEKQRPLTGSRLKPAPPLVDFRGTVSQIASDTGVAGFTPQSGMDPFAGGTRTVTFKTCKSSDARISRSAMCELAAAQAALSKNLYPAAIAAIDRVLSSPDSTPVDRFYAHRFGYQIASAEGDRLGRVEALRGMLASGLLPPDERLSARKSLVAIALASGDDRQAIAELELLTSEAPSEAQSQANLAALYDRSGFQGKARTRMESAVNIMRARKQDVPGAWLSYLSRP